MGIAILMINKGYFSVENPSPKKVKKHKEDGWEGELLEHYRKENTQLSKEAIELMDLNEKNAWKLEKKNKKI